MRTLAILPCIAACASSPVQTSSFSSVRERLAAEPTRLFMPAAADAGTLVARRWSADGWVDGTAPIALANGELVARGANDKLAIDTFDFAVGAIDLPATITGTALQLSDVRVELAAAPAAAITWTDDDTATAQVILSLTLSWSVDLNGTVTPLGAQKLDAVPLDIALAGAGDHVDATLGLHGAGTLWSWADLLELTKLDLTIAAATVD